MRTIGILVVLVLITLSVGYFKGWVSFASETDNGSTAFRVRIDQTKLKGDLKSLESATRGAAKSLGEAASAAKERLNKKGDDSANATVVGVSVAEGTLTLAYEDDEQHVLPITSDDRELVGQLKAGDLVVVRSHDGDIVEIHRR